jgi:hypothetical protein
LAQENSQKRWGIAVLEALALWACISVGREQSDPLSLAGKRFGAKSRVFTTKKAQPAPFWSVSIV